MTIISKLKLSDKSQTPIRSTPETRIRAKMLEALDFQIAAAEAEANGETYIRRAMRWISDPDSGERVRKEIPVRFKRWWWKDETGSTFLEVRYSNKRVPIKPGKTAIEVGDTNNLVPTLNLLKDAISGGELDQPLLALKAERGFPKKK